MTWGRFHKLVCALCQTICPTFENLLVAYKFGVGCNLTGILNFIQKELSTSKRREKYYLQEYYFFSNQQQLAGWHPPLNNKQHTHISHWQLKRVQQPSGLIHYVLDWCSRGPEFESRQGWRTKLVILSTSTHGTIFFYNNIFYWPCIIVINHHTNACSWC